MNESRYWGELNLSERVNGSAVLEGGDEVPLEMMFNTSHIITITAYTCLFVLSALGNISVLKSIAGYHAVLRPLTVTEAKRRVRLMLWGAWTASGVCSLPQAVIFHVETHPQHEWFRQCVTFNSFATPTHELLYNISGFIFMYFIDRNSAQTVDPRIQAALFIFAVANSTVNPLVYGYFNVRRAGRSSSLRRQEWRMKRVVYKPPLGKYQVGSASLPSLVMPDPLFFMRTELLFGFRGSAGCLGYESPPKQLAGRGVAAVQPEKKSRRRRRRRKWKKM
ncbi:hypothetical protein O3P69_018552 [Scylla paramamosain]|uniref:G-protein coupled receptors family 1 profile domain-containing protein n=1 Tax=Scylla paramamosain TaxID=85552 RepID=A0AAW0T2H7_SCYPA